MMSGKDLVNLFKKLKKREKKHGTIRKIKPVATSEVDADLQVEGVVGGAVEIAPVPDVANDAVGDAVEIAKAATSCLLIPPPKLPMAASKDASIISKKCICMHIHLYTRACGCTYALV